MAIATEPLILIDGVEHVTVPVAAARLGCSHANLSILLGKKKLAGIKLGRDWLISVPSLDVYLAHKRIHKTPQHPPRKQRKTNGASGVHDKKVSLQKPARPHHTPAPVKSEKINFQKPALPRPKPIDRDRYMTVRETAKSLNKTTTQVTYLLNNGQLEGVKENKKRWLVLRSSVSSYQSLLDRLNTDEWITPQEAASLMGMTPQWVQDLARDKKIRSERKGNRWFVCRADAERYEKRPDWSVKRWTGRERTRLRRLYGWLPVKELADNFGCRESQVIRQVRKMKLLTVRQRNDVLTIDQLAKAMGLSYCGARDLAIKSGLVVLQYEQNQPVRCVFRCEWLIWLGKAENSVYINVNKIVDEEFREVAVKLESPFFLLSQVTAMMGYSPRGFKHLFSAYRRAGMISAVKTSRGSKVKPRWYIHRDEVERLRSMIEREDRPPRFIENGTHYFRRGQIAKRLHLTREQIDKQAQEGKLETIRRGRLFYFGKPKTIKRVA